MWITRIAPFILPALFFQSAIFAFLSPLPLFLSTVRNKLWLTLLAFAVNIALIYAAGFAGGNPRESFAETIIVSLFWFASGILFPFLLRKSGKVQMSFALSVGYLLCMLGIGMVYLAAAQGLGVVEYSRAEISAGLDHLLAMPDSPIKALVDEQGREAILKQFLTELPSGIVMAVLLSFWINLLFASQLIQGFLPKNFWSEYHAPDVLIWPTLVCAILFVWADHALYYIGLNGLKILLIFYAFQGLSVLSHVLNHYKIFGFARAAIFTLVVFVAMPLVLATGFFDLWFDFRRKLVQS